MVCNAQKLVRCLAVVVLVLTALVAVGSSSTAAATTVQVSGRLINDVSGAAACCQIVEAHRLDASAPVVTGNSSLAGDYTLQLVPGTYRISYRSPSAGAPQFMPRSWNDGTGATYTPVVVVDTPITGLDARLVPRVGLGGSVKFTDGLEWSENARVEVVDVGTGAVVHTQDVSHQYRFQAILDPGTYRVQFNRVTDGRLGAGQYWQGVPEGDGVEAATELVLAPGGGRDDINVVIRRGGSVSGRLVDSEGAGHEGCTVVADDPEDRRSEREGVVARDGAYTINGLSAGSYRLRTDCGGTATYADASSPAGITTDPAEADLLSVDLAQTLPPVADMTLSGLPPLPVVTLPRVTQARAGFPVGLVDGSWSVADPSQTYQWLVDGVPVEGATSRDFVPSGEHGGRQLTLEVDARVPGSARSVVRSPPVTVEDTTPGRPGTPRLDMSRHGDTYSFGISWDPAQFPQHTQQQYQVVVELPDRPGELFPFTGVVVGDTWAEIRSAYPDTVLDLRVVAVGPAGQWSEPSDVFTVTSLGGQAPSFTDVSTSHAFWWQMTWLASVGVTTGYDNGNGTVRFEPGAPVLREQMAAFLHRLVGEPEVPAGSRMFFDVPYWHTFDTPIRWLAGTGITTGYADGFFRPGQPVLREQMAAFLYRLQTMLSGAAPRVDTSGPSPFADVSKSHAFYKEIVWLASTGVTTGYAGPNGTRTFAPSAPVLREQMAAFLYRFDQKQEDRRIVIDQAAPTDEILTPEFVTGPEARD